MSDDSRLNALVEACVAASPDLDGTDRAIVLALYRALAAGRPVAPEALARRAGLELERVRRTLDEWPCVFRDEAGRVIGFWGLALAEMPHRLRIGEVEIYAWCAWDPLFIGPLLGRPVEVESRCPVTGQSITMTVTPQGVRDLRPADAVLSFLEPDGTWGDDVITTFCHYVLLFGSEAAGHAWTAEREGTFLLSVDDGFELGRRVNAARMSQEVEPWMD